MSLKKKTRWGNDLLLYHLCHCKSKTCGQCADHHYAEGAAQRIYAGELTLEISENKQAAECYYCRHLQTCKRVTDKKIGTQWDESANDIRETDVEGAFTGPLGVGFVQSQLIFHHEVDPFVFVLCHLFHCLILYVLAQAQPGKEFPDFVTLSFRHPADLIVFPFELGIIMIHCGSACQVAA